MLGEYDVESVGDMGYRTFKRDSLYHLQVVVELPILYQHTPFTLGCSLLRTALTPATILKKSFEPESINVTNDGKAKQ